MRNLRRVGVKEVHLRISCPPHRYPCFYGIDFHKSSELIANRYESIEKIRQFLGVDSLGYLSLEGMLSCLKHPVSHYCTACWSGRYQVKPEKKHGKFSLEARGLGYLRPNHGPLANCCGQGGTK